MNEFLENLGLAQILTSDRLLALSRALIILLVGMILARMVSGGVLRALRHRMNNQEAMLARRLVYYLLVSLVLAATMHQLGFQLGVLLGAAGILTVAIGFASQTSAANLISGLFLIAERPFVVGDLLDIDGKVGEVLSIDLLSVKLRTFDNLMVRVPNEQMIKSTFTNLSRFPLRRLDLRIGVAYKEDMEKVRRVLMETADHNALSLDEPEPLFIYRGYGDSALEFQFSVWAKRENYLELRNTIYAEIKNAFDANGIEIPFPHRTLYTGSVTDPFPVRVVESGPPKTG
jgi:small-conductance mechanosensitive channel